MTDPYLRAQAVTKSDTVNLPGGTCDALQVGGAGIVQAVLENDLVVPITCVAGQWIPLRIKRVNSTSTTATVMTAFYRT